MFMSKLGRVGRWQLKLAVGHKISSFFAGFPKRLLSYDLLANKKSYWSFLYHDFFFRQSNFNKYGPKNYISFLFTMHRDIGHINTGQHNN